MFISPSQRTVTIPAALFFITPNSIPTVLTPTY